ncbi:MAG: hypothetical protein FWE44_02955 [Defluviitaleaceae bacterium]|nr:hypothetical protein [Defluviitaleaceae bacterium]
MKKAILTAGLCLLAGLAMTNAAYGADQAEYDQDFSPSHAAFWRKKDKQEEVAPDQEAPTEDKAPENNKPQSDASFVYNPTTIRATPSVQGGGNMPNTQQNNGTMQQSYPQTQYNQPSQHGGTRVYSGTEYMPGINEQIEKILASQPAIKLDPNAYIIQHEDALWLVMGNIRAKLDILIYVDGKHIEAEFPTGHDRGNTLPIFK